MNELIREHAIHSAKKILLVLALTAIIGCAHVISREVREEADRELTPEILFRDPDAYKGKIVILGGVIISSKNTDKGTHIEVLQNPIDSRGRPEDTDVSYGRFLIFYEGYLDTAIYSMGRKVTVVGEVLGKKTRPLGEVQYSYLLIKSKELHILKPRSGYPVRFSIGIWKTF